MKTREEYELWFKSQMGIQSESDYNEDFWLDGLDVIEAAMKFEVEFGAYVDDDKLDGVTFNSHKDFVDFLFKQLKECKTK